MVTSAHVCVETVAMADALSKKFGKLGLAGLGNRNGDDEEREDESAQAEGEKSREAKPDGGVPEPGAVKSREAKPDGMFATRPPGAERAHSKPLKEKR